ncbi:class II myosin [Fusarium falciforme]|nr:class II myosin [Fusarium falciforme]
MGISRRPKNKDARAGAAAGASGSAKPKKATFETTKKKEIGVSDLTLLSKVSNEAINENLKKRFEGAEIYTYIGHVLVSVNPFRDLGIYTDQVLDTYKGKNRLEMPPHVFAIAESAYYNMKAYNDNQCVIISGESGAGKTEAAKRIMQYIASVSGGESGDIKQIKDMVLATNPCSSRLETQRHCETTTRRDSANTYKFTLTLRANPWAPTSQTTSWRRREWWARLQTSATSTSFTNSQRALRSSTERPLASRNPRRTSTRAGQNASTSTASTISPNSKTRSTP